MFIKARGNISAQAFATEGMSTRIRTSDRIIGHLLQTYAAHEQSLGELSEICALCRERTVFFVKLVLQAYRIKNTITAVRRWSRSASSAIRVTRCATRAWFGGEWGIREHTVFFVKFVLQAHRIKNTIIAVRWWSRWAARVTWCASRARFGGGWGIWAKRVEGGSRRPGG